MDINNMKNIIILKNLPSNLVEEAIVVVRNKKEIVDINYSTKKEKAKEKNKKTVIQGYMKEEDFKKIEKIQKDNREYVIKEAEIVVSEYLNRIEDLKNYKEKEKLERKYNKIKYINMVLIVTSFLSTLICIIK